MVVLVWIVFDLLCRIVVLFDFRYSVFVFVVMFGWFLKMMLIMFSGIWMWVSFRLLG